MSQSIATSPSASSSMPLPQSQPLIGNFSAANVPHGVMPASSKQAAASPRTAARRFAVGSLTTGLSVLAATLTMGLPGHGHALAPVFAVFMLMVLLVGVACGIFAVAWNNDPRHTAIKIAGILGICLNAFFLLMVCGAAHCG